MKPVDILAVELKVWPADAEAVFYGDAGRLAYFYLGTGFRDCLNVHPDAASEIEPGVYRITRAQWQAAVDALKVEKVVEWHNGIPPVGTTCERRFPNVESSSWQGGIVLAHGSRKIFFRDNCGDEWAHSIDDVEFRPFRTPEQISADELRSIISSGLDGKKTLTQVVYEIIGCGYRKTPPMDN